MKRRRSIGASGAKRLSTLLSSPFSVEDCLQQLSAQLGNVDDVLLLDPHACAARHDEESYTTLSSLSLLLLDLSRSRTAEIPCSHRYTLWGMGVLDGRFGAAGDDDHQERGDGVVWHVVPVELRVVPWQMVLPRNLESLIREKRGFVYCETDVRGDGDAAPIPEGFLSRDAVVMLHGLPRCRVQAVSGRFPLFQCRPPCSAALLPTAEVDEVEWILIPEEKVTASRASEAAERHRQALRCFCGGGLSSLAKCLTPELGVSVPPCWVVVSYTDGLPPTLTPEWVETGAHGSPQEEPMTSADDNAAADSTVCIPRVAPAFIVPSQLLLQSFHVKGGWRRIAPSSRPNAARAFQRLRSVVESLPLRYPQGERLASYTVCCSPDVSPRDPILLQKASTV